VETSHNRAQVSALRVSISF